MLLGHIAIAQCNSINYDPNLCGEAITGQMAEHAYSTPVELASASDTFYLRSNTANPWSSTSNQAAMNAAFGSGNWTEVFYQTVDPAVIFSSSTRFVFMEGSDGLANAMNTFLATNITLIENWVAQGKTLLMNAAPNQGGNIDFGFGGSTLVYSGGTHSPSVNVVDTNHPTFLGPNLPVSTVMTGNSYAHAHITGTGFTDLLVNSSNPAIVPLREKAWGNGVVMMGGMTTTNFHSPNLDGTNYRVNLLVYLESLATSIDCPSDITVSNDPGQCGAVVTFPDATASNSGGSLPVTQTAGLPSGSFFPIGDTLIEFTADDNGTLITCTFTITVEDNEAPTITCPTDIIVNNDPGVCGAVVNYTIDVDDNCPLLSQNGVINGDASDGFNNWNITQNSGHGWGITAGGNFITSWALNVKNQIVDLVAMGFTESYLDSSPEITVSEDHIGGWPNYSDLYFFNAELRDANNNVLATFNTGNLTATNAWQTISHTFTNYPEGVRYVFVEHGGRDAEFWAGHYGVVINNTNVTVARGAIQTAGLPSGSVFPIGTTTNTFVVTDDFGNTATCSFDITVEDNEAPEAICVAPFTIQLDANGQASITAADIDAGSTDNCGIATIEIDRTDFDCSDLTSGGSTNYVYALYPWSGSDNIYLYDFDPVTLDLNFNSVAGSTNIEENYGFDVNPVTGEYYLLGEAGSQRGIYSLDMNTFNATLITTVTSTTGNQNAQDFVINNAGEFVILYQDGSVNKLDINTLTTSFFATVSTPGGGVGFTYDYENDRYLIAHNTNPVELKALSATGTVTNLFSFHTPVIPTCTAQAIEYVGNGKCIVSSTFGCDILYSIDLNTETVELIASPNGSPNASIKDLLYNFSDGSGSTHTVTLTITDVNGNVSTCTTTVTVEDSIAPAITCISNQTVDTDAAVCNYTHNGTAWDATATDNCSIASTEYELTGVTTGTGTTLDGVVFNLGETTVTWTTTDGSGNTATCSFTVTVEDNEAPMALCVAPFTIQLDANGQASITVADIDNGSTDNCGIDTITISQTDFDCSHVGDNTITLTVTDVNGNTSTCTTVVTVEDNVAPEALCVAPFTVELDFFGMAYITVSDIDNGSNDACGIASMSLDITEFSCANIGDNVVTLTVVDNNGNTSTCTTVVTVVDTMAPQIVCPNDIVINTEPGMCSAFVFFGAASAYDNCDGFIPTVQTAGPPSGSVFPIGVTTITFTATDSSGNTSSCDFTITVVDNQAPLAVCQNITIQLGADGLATITAEDLDGGSTDNCGTPLIFTASQTTFDCSNVGQNSVILTVTDAAGNSSTCTAIVTVEDSIAPVALCAAPFTIELDANGIATIDIADIDAGSTDNCSIASIELSQSTFTCADLGENVITLTVTDPSGNVSTCTTTVTVIDVIAPVLTCIDFTLELGPDGTAFLTPEDIGGTSTDNCAITITAIDIEEFDCSDIGTPVLVTYFASDASGNIASCTAWVTVVDNLGPVIDCPDAMTVDTDPNSITYTVPDYFGEGIVTATDNCTIPVTVFSQTPAPGTLLLDGTYTITLTATDEYGNTSTCSFELTVESILGDEDRLDFSSLTMYPNPATHMVTIGNPQSIAIDRVSIYDVQGRLVFVKNTNGETGNQTINVSDLSSAVYMVVIESSGRQSVKRLVRK